MAASDIEAEELVHLAAQEAADAPAPSRWGRVAAVVGGVLVVVALASSTAPAARSSDLDLGPPQRSFSVFGVLAWPLPLVPLEAAPAWPSMPEPATAGDHFVQLDDKAKTPALRQEMKGFVRELLIKYPLKSNPIKVNGKTAYIPFGSIMEGEFSLNAYTQGQTHYGVDKTMAFISNDNPKSMISDKVKLAFAEKSHTYYFLGDMPHVTKDRLDAEQAAQSPLTKLEATMMRQAKLTALAGSAAAYGMQIANTGKDPKQMEAVREFVATDAGAMTQALWQAVNRSNSELKERKAKTTAKVPLRSAVGCLHLENPEVMNFTADGVQVPLDHKIVAWRGQAASYPNEEYQMANGFAVFFHNIESDSLDVYFGFASVIDFVDAIPRMVAKFSVGPPDGDKWPIAPESRLSSVLPPLVAPVVEAASSAVYSVSELIPTDFTYLHLDRIAAGCTDGMLSSLPAESQHMLDLLRVVDGRGGDNTVFSMSSLDMIPAASQAYQSAMGWIHCGVEYLRPVHSNAAARMGSLQLMILLHIISELDPQDVAKVVATHTVWNMVNGTELASPY